MTVDNETILLGICGLDEKQRKTVRLDSGSDVRAVFVFQCASTVDSEHSTQVVFDSYLYERDTRKVWRVTNSGHEVQQEMLLDHYLSELFEGILNKLSDDETDSLTEYSFGFLGFRFYEKMGAGIHNTSALVRLNVTS